MLGSPIAHSLSPALHRAAYASLQLDWTYDAFDVDADGLAPLLAHLDDSWSGLSLTMPLKEVVVPLLDEVDDEARRLQSVNTVLPRDGGGWRGTNTDVYGIVQALTEGGLAPQPSSATLLGAGATARSAVAALARLGTRDLVICARRESAAGELAELARGFGLVARTASLNPDPALAQADVLISTLPGAVASEWASVGTRAEGALLDASYHPWPTPLADAWSGAVVASGRDMLVWQAAAQVRLMTGREPSVEAMFAALPN